MSKISIEFINSIYDNLTYTNVYAPFIFLNIILIVGLIQYIAFINVMKKINYYKDNWDTERCKPTLLPFAGFINKPENQTNFQFTSNNFQYCIQNIIQMFAGASINPFYYITSVLTELFSVISEIINTIRGMINYIRNCLSDIFDTVFGRIINTTSALQRVLTTLKDTMAKSLGYVVLLYYFVQSLFLTGFSLIGTFIEAMIIVLIVITALVLIFFLQLNPFAAVIFIIIYALVAIPLIYIIYLFSNLPQFGKNSSIPSLKTCFDKNTIFKLSNGKEITISQLKVGDILEDGTIIQCHFILDASRETMYYLNDVIVSGSHPVLYNNQWISVSEHPNVEKIKNYHEKYIYCLNTSNKKIVINNIIFSDWDDVLNENRASILLNNFNDKNLNNIHKYYDKGFTGTTLIKMHNESFKPISQIKVGDILHNFIKVYGIVHIKSDDLINGNLLNISNISNNKDLGTLYNLLTNANYFYVNNLKYNDFNSCLDKYL